MEVGEAYCLCCGVLRGASPDKSILGPIGIDRAGKVFGGASWGVLAT